MFRNYFKVASRYLLRHKGYAMINILGLSVGVATCLLIMLFVKSEWSFDRFNSKSDRLYRVWLQENYGPDKIFTNTGTPLPLGAAMKQNMPDVESTCRVFLFTSNMKAEDHASSINETVNMVDTSFFKMFDFRLSRGNRDVPFPTPNSILLTKETARKFFGDEDAMGKNIQVQLGDDQVPFIVSGIVDHVPQESSIRFDALVSFGESSHIFTQDQMTAWQEVYPETYALLKNPSTDQVFSPKFDALAKLIAGNHYKPGRYNLHLQPITDIHLNNTLPAGNYPTSSPVYSYVLGTIGLLILLIACINFITLSVGRSTTRAMEVGVRKVLGADRKQLVQQFWMEAFLFTITSVFIGFLIALACLKPFDNLFQRQLTLAFDPPLIFFMIGLIAFIALTAGIYPSLILSAFNPTEVFQRKTKSGNNMGLLRRSLIAGQFIASISMIICTLVINRQLNYVSNKDLGYNKNQIIVVPMNKGGEAGDQLAALYKNELKQIPQVKSYAAALYSFSDPWVHMGFNDDEKRYRNIKMNAIDANFIPTMGIQMIAGRNFQEGNTDDRIEGVIINQEFANEFGWKDPIGQKLPGKFNETVVGEVKDFNFESLHNKIEPLVLAMQWDSMLNQANDVNISVAPEPRVSVRLTGGSLSENISLLKNAWKKIAPDQDFEYHFLDETLAAQYSEEQHVSTMILAASLISIFIACMGLFGLATLIVNRRTKEIGIRKILGANYANILALISRDFVFTVAISSLIAFPVSWWAMNRWLQDFAYRIDMSWWIFILALVIALLITIITVGLNTMKVALANPVKSLRTE